MVVLPGVDVQAAVAFLVEDEHRYANGHCTRQAPVDPRMTCNKLLHCDVKQRTAMLVIELCTEQCDMFICYERKKS